MIDSFKAGAADDPSEDLGDGLHLEVHGRSEADERVARVFPRQIVLLPRADGPRKSVLVGDGRIDFLCLRST